MTVPGQMEVLERLTTLRRHQRAGVRSHAVSELKGAVAVRSTAYSYDLNSNPRTVHAQQFGVDAEHEARSTFTEYTWDVRNLVDTIKTGTSPTSTPDLYSYTYDARGQVATLTKPNGNKTSYGYFEDGLVRSMIERTSVANGAELVAEHWMRYTPDGDLSRDFSKIDQSGSAGGFLNQTTLYEYTPNRQVATVTRNGEEAGRDEEYRYDEAGNVDWQQIGTVTTDFDYVRGRLDWAETGGARANYRYDVFGRTSAVDVGGTVVRRWGYDGFDRQVWHREWDTAGVRQSSHTKDYDPFDRTTTETVQVGSDPATTTRFIHLGVTDRVAVEEQRNAAGGWDPSKTYHYGADGRPLSLRDTPVDTSTDRKLFYGWNPHGDVETLTNATTGEPAATYRYTAYGDADPVGTTGLDAIAQDPVQDADVVNPYRYSGHRYTGLTGSYDFGFRDYDPGLNRYLTRDMYNNALSDLSLGLDPWNTNRYTLTGGNPISRIDLDGHINDVDGTGDFPAGTTMEEIDELYNDEGYYDDSSDDDDAPVIEREHDAWSGFEETGDLFAGLGGGITETVDAAVPDEVCVPTGPYTPGGGRCAETPSATDAYEDKVEEWGVNTDGWAYTIGEWAPVGAGLVRSGVRLGARFATRTATNTGTIDPTTVRFSQDSVTYTFKDGRTIAETAEALRSGALDPSAIPTVRLFERNGNLYTLDNRRLAAFSEAGVPMPYRIATPEEVISEQWKFTTTTDGRTIQYALFARRLGMR